jgi:hypothetical protein
MVVIAAVTSQKSAVLNVKRSKQLLVCLTLKTTTIHRNVRNYLSYSTSQDTSILTTPM